MKYPIPRRTFLKHGALGSGRRAARAVNEAAGREVKV
jgi:hypothetical protein